MFSIQKFFSQDSKFFDLLEASAEETLASTRLLVDLLKDPARPHPLSDFAVSRGKDKLITEQISEELVNTFVTGLEREDIEMLSNAMYRICKTIEKFAERYSLVPDRLVTVDFTRQIELVVQATDTLGEMVRHLRRIPTLEVTKQMNDRMQAIETEADNVMLELLREVYSGKYDALQAMLVRDLHDLLEKVIDRCRDAGNVVSHIVMKNS